MRVLAVVLLGLGLGASCQGCGALDYGPVLKEAREVAQEAAQEAVFVTMCEPAVMSQAAEQGIELPLAAANEFCVERYQKYLENREQELKKDDKPKPLPKPTLL